MANYIRSYVRDTRYAYPFVDGEIVRNITGLSDINAETKKIYSTTSGADLSSYSPSIARSPNYIYFFSLTSEMQKIFYEYDIANDYLRSHVSSNCYNPFVVLEDRKIIVAGISEYDWGSALYLIDFANDSEVKIVDFEHEIIDGVQTFFYEDVLFLTEYNNKKYIIYGGNVDYPYEIEQYGCAFFVYNYTDNIKIQKYSKNHTDSIKAQSYPHSNTLTISTFIDNKLIFVPNIWIDSYIPLHIFDLNDLENSLYIYEYSIGTETEIQNIVSDIENNNIYLKYFSPWGTGKNELLKFNLNDKIFSVASSFDIDDSITFCVGNEECFIFQNSTKYWYNINNLSVPVTNQVTTPSGGYLSVRDNLSFAYDDIGKRIWHFNRDLKEIVGISTNGEYDRSISADITYYSTKFSLIRLFDLGDMFLVTIIYSTSPYPYEMYLIKSTDWNPPVFPKNKFQAIWWNGG